MKHIVVILVLLVLLIVFVVLNAVYINKVANRMLDAVSALPPIADETAVSAAASLREDWLRATPFVDLTVSYLLSDRVCEQTALLVSCAEAGDVYGYASARAILSDALEDMRRTELFSPVSLF